MSGPNSLILIIPRTLQISQLAELGRFEGNSNELQNHNNGATKFHACTTIATPHFFFSFILLLLCYKW